MQNLEKFRRFLNFEYSKTAKVSKGPFCQIRAQWYSILFEDLLLECYPEERKT